MISLCVCFVTAKADSIRVKKSCFTINEDISIMFQGNNPQPLDWIGIYHPSVPSALPSPSDNNWLRTCGSRNCTSSSAISFGTITYRDKLQIGSWKMVLVHDESDGAPYTALAQSSTFEVRWTCGSPSTTPVIVPTGTPVRSPTRTPVRSPTRAPTARSSTRAPTARPSTRAPTARPSTRAPVKAPTRAPTKSSTFATTNKSSYTVGEQIEITFKNGSPTQGDWIGVYPSSISINNLQQGALWVWSCGSQTCGSSPSSGTVIIRSGTSWTGSEWPLAAGSWQAYLLRNNVRNGNGGFVPIAKTETFSVKSSRSSGGGTISAAVSAARLDLEDIIIGQGGDKKLAAKFLRLMFHDCVGGCDGCVDLTNPDNFGLLVPIEALRPVVSKHAKKGFTRADVWALAAVVGVDVMQPSQRIDFNLDSVGRVNCEDANTICRNAAGAQQACSETLGPDRHLPGMNTPSRDLFSFFDKEFGFSIKETVAIMGAHTIGRLRKENSGVDAPNGWLLKNNVFDNGYYAELIGGTSASQSLDIHVNQAPGWQRGVELNNPNGIPDRNIWVGFPNGIKIVMLNVDIALVRLLDSSNMDQNGKVSCKFRKSGACPANNLSIQFAIDYTFDNLLWLNDFRDVLTRMLRRGYTKTSNCDGSICVLSPI